MREPRRQRARGHALNGLHVRRQRRLDVGHESAWSGVRVVEREPRHAAVDQRQRLRDGRGLAGPGGGGDPDEPVLLDQVREQAIDPRASGQPFGLRRHRHLPAYHPAHPSPPIQHHPETRVVERFRVG